MLLQVFPVPGGFPPPPPDELPIVRPVFDRVPDRPSLELCPVSEAELPEAESEFEPRSLFPVDASLDGAGGTRNPVFGGVPLLPERCPSPESFLSPPDGRDLLRSSVFVEFFPEGDSDFALALLLSLAPPLLLLAWDDFLSDAEPELVFEDGPGSFPMLLHVCAKRARGLLLTSS